MKLPRMTTRRWVVAVFLIAMSLGVLQRRFHFQRIAADHRAAIVALSKGTAITYLPNGQRRSLDVWFADDRILLSKEAVARQRSTSDWHVTLAETYERAARYPWLPVRPGSPGPD